MSSSKNAESAKNVKKSLHYYLKDFVRKILLVGNTSNTTMRIGGIVEGLLIGFGIDETISPKQYEDLYNLFIESMNIAKNIRAVMAPLDETNIDSITEKISETLDTKLDYIISKEREVENNA